MTPFRVVLIHGLAGSGKDSLADALRAQNNLATTALADPIKVIARDVWGCDSDALWGPSERRQKPVPGDIEWAWCAGRPQFGLSPARPGCGIAGHTTNVVVRTGYCVCGGHMQWGPLTIRRLLQHLGTEIGREVDPGVWVRALRRRIAQIRGGAEGEPSDTSYRSKDGTYWPAWKRDPDLGWTSAIAGVVVPDVRFANELVLLSEIPEATVTRIKLVRPGALGTGGASAHSSEGGLADDLFDLVVDVPEIPEAGARAAFWADVAGRVLV